MDWRQRQLEIQKLELDRNKAHVDYLVRLYGFYTSHMNQVFNFYLVSTALIAGAFVQSLAGPNPLLSAGSQWIAYAGAGMSVLFWLLHERSDRIAHVLDAELGQIESTIGASFQPERLKSKRRFPWLSNKWLFRVLYFVFFFAFIVASCNIDRIRGAPAPLIDKPAASAAAKPIGTMAKPTPPPAEQAPAGEECFLRPRDYRTAASNA